MTHFSRHRRNFMRGLSFGLLGTGFSELLHRQLHASIAGGGRAKRCILLFLWGGPSQIDTFDMKPEAPIEYRGEFQPIQTSIPGIEWCEHLPLTAQMSQHVAVVRSLTQNGRGGLGDHHTDAYYLLTGNQPTATDRLLSINRKPQPDDWPFIGSTVAYCRPHASLPSVVALPKIHGTDNGYVVPGQFATKLGAAYEPLLLSGTPDPKFTRSFLPRELRAPDFTLPDGMNADRLAGRKQLLSGIDRWQRENERHVAQFQSHQLKAFSLLTSPETKRAFDLNQEPEELRQRYGENINGQSTLLARRLTEAGVPFVVVHWNTPEYSPLVVNWDTHADNFMHLKRDLLPVFDRMYATLLDDLDQRGLLDSTLVVALGEMGRTPKYDDPRVRGTNSKPGRDHWPHCMFALLAGGGIRGGQVYGSSDRIASHPANNPVYPEDLAATIYGALGITREELTAKTPDGRPIDLLSQGEALPLFG
ncbi:MAG: DUF1501 domain-containing protein [Planctomycetaceae bacterium]